MKTIAVIFGGRSAEHDVSIITGIASVIKPLELSGEFDVVAVYIAKDGSWYWDDKLKDIKLFQSGEIEEFMHKAPKVHILFDGGLTLVKSSQFAGRKAYKKIDIVFPAMHGTHGEDGELMGLLDMANVPYVGCDMPSSAIAMDKVTARLIVMSRHIPTPTMVFFPTAEFDRSPDSILEFVKKELKYPLFVKPAHLGSSIGITRVESAKELVNAIEVAGHYDDKVLVEEAVQNLIELTLPIMGNLELVPAYLERPMVKDQEFFDFDTKYMKSGKGGKKMGGQDSAQGYSTIPADIPEDMYKKAETLGLDVFRAIGCTGFARVDMLVDSKTGKVYFNEINPMPGSLYTHNWQKKGVSSVALVTKLVDLALERHAAKERLHTSFATNFLKQF